MNDEDPKPGVVIDVTPEPEPDAPAQPAGEAPAASARSGLLAMALAVLALVLVGIGVGLGYRYWGQLSADLAEMQQRVQSTLDQQRQLRQSLQGATDALDTQKGALGEQQALLEKQRAAVDQARSDFQQQEKRLADENLQLQEREAELRAAVADVHRRVGSSGTQWMIAETDYLLRIANHRLQLARDTGTARVALELADQRLRDTQDPGWAGVREQIARDIARLGAFEQPDSAGLAARLGALGEQVQALKLARATIGPERTLPETVAREPGERSWDTLFEDLWAGFKDSVRIRERDQPVQAMLAPEQQFFLYENLRLRLEGARLAVARGDQTLFHDNLTTAADWLRRYFDPADTATGAMLGAIDGMLKVDLRPELPDISQSLRALEVRRKLLQDLTVGDTEAPR